MKTKYLLYPKQLGFPFVDLDDPFQELLPLMKPTQPKQEAEQVQSCPASFSHPEFPAFGWNIHPDEFGGQDYF